MSDVEEITNALAVASFISNVSLFPFISVVSITTDGDEKRTPRNVRIIDAKKLNNKKSRRIRVIPTTGRNDNKNGNN